MDMNNQRSSPQTMTTRLPHTINPHPQLQHTRLLYRNILTMGKNSKVARRPVDSKEAVSNDVAKNSSLAGRSESPLSKDLVAEHLPPIGLVMIVMACTGILWVFAMRDVFATGRIIAGHHDEAMQYFTKSTMFFSNAKGWKSQQGGLSSIQHVTTDANNMGGLFVRKMGGAAALALQTQKVMPLLFHPLAARWRMGHFRPTFWLACVANLAVAAFYASYLEDFAAAGADVLPMAFIAILMVETVAILGYLYFSRNVKRGPAIAMTNGKTPKSVPSRIVSRTVLIVSTLMTLIAGRDLFFPGKILGFIPRDDIYLEWTGAFLHSPPEGSPEADENGLSSAFFVADKYLSQFLALNVLLACMYKFATAFGISYGSDGGGLVKARIIWKVQFLGEALMLLLFRLFAPAALTASLDLRWHLMFIGYECFILGLYGYF